MSNTTNNPSGFWREYSEFIAQMKERGFKIREAENFFMSKKGAIRVDHKGNLISVRGSGAKYQEVTSAISEANSKHGKRVTSEQMDQMGKEMREMFNK